MTVRNYYSNRDDPNYNGAPIDNIVVSSNIEIMDSGVNESKLNYSSMFEQTDAETGVTKPQYDHFPLWATLQIN